MIGVKINLMNRTELNKLTHWDSCYKNILKSFFGIFRLKDGINWGAMGHHQEAGGQL